MAKAPGFQVPKPVAEIFSYATTLWLAPQIQRNGVGLITSGSLYCSMTAITLEAIRVELEQVIRSAPPTASMHHYLPENLEWLGRATAVVYEWTTKTRNIEAWVGWQAAVSSMHTTIRPSTSSPSFTVMRVLYQAQTNLRMTTVGPVSISVDKGRPFDYFDEVRKIIEQASAGILFVDPYLNADFVSRYMPHVKQGVAIRLLCSKHAPAVKSACEVFTKQNGLAIEVRKAGSMHDRWFFIDGRRCFQSGASFKDGAVNSSTTLIENVDSFGVLQTQFEGLWQQAEIC